MNTITKTHSRIRQSSPWLLLFAFLLIGKAHAGWAPVGPFGGDVRSLAADPSNPDRMYLGTRTGQIFFTTDGAGAWNRLTSFEAPSDLVVDHLVIDPTDTNVLYAAGWSLLHESGGVYKSTDRGKTWRELAGIKGQSVRTLAMAPSSSKTLVAGSLQGVFRTDDGGASWRRISPAGHQEIRNVESIVIDPVHPDIIYVGTWHLPWKTEDGGKNWVSIKKGIIDDSDVFSIVIDPSNNRTLYASACTGIYRSDSAGAEWKKIQGIPYSSRRTRVLSIDSRKPNTVYAGTTEGLWRTKNGGESWVRLTHHTWVINSIEIDPRNSQHLFLGMDQSGVMESWDSGSAFQAANQGFAQRQISSIVADPATRGRFFASLGEDGPAEAVIVTNDNGANWRPTGSGLEGRGVLNLLLTTQPDWRLLAATSDGIFEYSLTDPVWKNNSQIRLRPSSPYSSFTGISVWKLYRRSDSEPIYAATSAGLLESKDGRSWRPLPLPASRGGVAALATGGTEGRVILVANAAGLKVSRDAGQTWAEIHIDGDNQLMAEQIASDPSHPDVFFVGASTGLFRSIDAGITWEKFGHGLPFSSIRQIVTDPNRSGYIVVASSSGLFESSDGGTRYNRFGEPVAMDDLPIHLLALHPLSSLPFLAASPYNGLFVYDGKEAPKQDVESAAENVQ